MAFRYIYLTGVLYSVGCLLVSGIEDHGDAWRTILDKIEKLEERNNFLEWKSSVLEQTVNELKTVVQDQQTELNLLKANRQQQYGNLVSTNRDKNKKRLILNPTLPVAFTSRITSLVVDHVNPGDAIHFNDILTNQGGGFNANTSIFVAPMAGIYVISCSLMDHQARSDGSGVMLHADIIKNGATVLARVFAHAEGASYRDQGANTIFVELQTGDKVWVRNWNSPDLGVGGELYSTFSGYLLWPLE